MHDALAARLHCPSCGLYFDDRSPRSACVNCSSLLELQIESGVGTGSLRAAFDGRTGLARGAAASGVWRYRELVLPTIADEDIVSFPEGNTPLIESRAIGDFAGAANLSLKHEGMNPTGSFKDRGMTVAITQAKRIGAKAVACASTGNTSASLAAYAALAGLPGIVLVPAGHISTGKLAQTLAHGAKTVAVRGNFDDCLRLLREASERLGVYVVNSVNPFRLAGQRTIVLEMLHQLGWNPPDVIALPAGNLGNTAAFGEALRLAMEAKLIAKMPKIVAVQAAGAAPFAAAYADGFSCYRIVEPETIATAIRIGEPASWDRAVRTILRTGGIVTSVTDDEILAAKKVIDEAGIGCEPASAASVAGVRKLIASGSIAADARIVAVLTGHVLKDTAIVVERAAPPVEIEPDVDSLARVMSPP